MKKIQRAIKVRLYPTQDQKEFMKNNFGSVRWVYNHYLSESEKLYREEKKYLDFGKCQKELAQKKKEEDYKFLKNAESTSLIRTLRDLEQAYRNFYKKTSTRPVHKSKKSTRQSYTVSCVNSNVKIKEGEIILPKLGNVICSSNASEILKNKKINSVTISTTASGKYLAAIQYEADVKELDQTGEVVGLNLSFKSFTLSNGEVFENQEYFKEAHAKLAREQRKMSLMSNKLKARGIKLEKASNYQKQRQKVAKIHEAITNKKIDYLQKLSTSLVEKYDVIVMEDIDSLALLHNKKTCEDTYHSAWMKFKKMMEYKCNWYGKQLVFVDSFQTAEHLLSKLDEVKQAKRILRKGMAQLASC